MQIVQPHSHYHWSELRRFCFQITRQARRITLGEWQIHLLDFRPYQVTPGWSIGLHTHSFYEAHLFLEGEAYCSLDTGDYQLAPGSIMLHPPHVPHRWHSGETPVLRLVFWFQTDTPLPTTAPHCQSLPDLLTETAALLRDVKDATAGWGDRAALRLGIMISRLISANVQNENASDDKDISYEQMTVVEQFLRDNLARPLAVADIAAHVGMSPSGVAHRFARETGQALMDRFFSLRMDRAAELLLDTDADLSTIGAQVGISDPSYFCRRFRQHFGMTPTEYRKAASISAGKLL